MSLPDSGTRRTVVVLLVLAILAAAGGLVAAPASAAGDRGRAAPSMSLEAQASAGATEAAITMLRETTGISRAVALTRLTRQPELARTAATLARTLGDRAAGSWIDHKTGRLVVNVLDGRAAATVRGNGAQARLVKRSGRQLNRVMKGLDELARTAGAGRTASWSVDVRSNSVVVEVPEGATDARTAAFVRRARANGPMVRIRAAVGQPKLTAVHLFGGNQIDRNVNSSPLSPCSLGFNTVDAANRPTFLTAGHCTFGSSSLSFSSFGVYIGPKRTSAFPGTDDGSVWNHNPAYAIPGPWVNAYNNYVLVMKGWLGASALPNGSAICKSGRTTGWTCGYIRGYPATLNAPEGTVNNLVQHSACVESGDSGGPNVTLWPSPNWYALGVTSGAVFDPADRQPHKSCLQKRGQPESISYYQPIGPALARHGLTLVTG